MSAVTPGLELVLESPTLIGDRRWALLSNHAAVTRNLKPARLALREALSGPLQRLFAPEHGLDGVAQDMEAVEHEIDPLTGVGVCSLYGASAETLEPTAEHLEDVDVVLVDLPDIGARHYTFAATMDAMMKACAAQGRELVVLDRPNPLGGLLREGGLVHAGFESFVSRLPTPVRHGLTLGELALLLHRERYPELELTVVTCRGWRRGEWWDETGLPWVPPSPNMPTLETAVLYPGLCLVEATELSEGRGTTRPFHWVGAPWVDGLELARRMGDLDLPGIAFRDCRFRPMFGKHGGEVCGGVELVVQDRLALRPVALGVWLIKTARDLNPRRFSWRQAPYEFVSEVPAIDLLTGSDAARRAIESGTALESVLEQWCREVESFESRVEGIVLETEPRT